MTEDRITWLRDQIQLYEQKKQAAEVKLPFDKAIQIYKKELAKAGQGYLNGLST